MSLAGVVAYWVTGPEIERRRRDYIERLLASDEKFMIFARAQPCNGVGASLRAELVPATLSVRPSVYGACAIVFHVRVPRPPFASSKALLPRYRPTAHWSVRPSACNATTKLH